MEDFSEVQEELDNAQREGRNEQPATLPKIQFTTEQQEKVNDLIRRAQGRAAKETREELARVKAELDALKTAAPNSSPDAAELARELAMTRAERDALAREKTDTALNAELFKAAASNNFHDPAIAADLVRNRVRMVDGRLVATDAAGNVRLNSQLEPMSVSEALTELAEQKPFLVRTTVRSGSGSVESRGPVDRHNSIDKLFGPNAEPGAAAKLNKIALRDIREYRRLLDAAREKGLVR